MVSADQNGDVMNPIVKFAPRGQQSDYEDLAAIDDFGAFLLIFLAQPDAGTAIPQMREVAGLMSAMRGRPKAGRPIGALRLPVVS